jgi:hypothetical protein
MQKEWWASPLAAEMGCAAAVGHLLAHALTEVRACVAMPRQLTRDTDCRIQKLPDIFRMQRSQLLLNCHLKISPRCRTL